MTCDKDNHTIIKIQDISVIPKSSFLPRCNNPNPKCHQETLICFFVTKNVGLNVDQSYVTRIVYKQCRTLICIFSRILYKQFRLFYIWILSPITFLGGIDVTGLLARLSFIEHFLDLSILLHILVVSSFLLLSSILLCGYTTICLSVYLLMNIWVVASF